MPGPFDYSKWDNIDTSSDEDEDEPSSADAMQSLHDYATAHGMDAELVSDTLGQCGGDPRAALEYLIDFMEMGEAPAPVPAPVPAPAPKPAAASASRPGPAPSAAAGGGQAAGGSGSGGGGVAASSLSTWELEEEMGAGLQQIHELKQKRQGNAAALGALSSLEAGRPPHQRSDQRANRQWVNMGDLFVKLPQRQLEATLTNDQKTIESETAALAQQNQVYSVELTRRRAAAAGGKQRR